MKKKGNSKFTWSIVNVKYLIFITIGGLLLIYLASIIVAWFGMRHRYKLINENYNTIGRIVRLGSMKGRYAVIEYYVDSTHYEFHDGAPKNFKEGEFYRVFYDKNNHDDAIVDYTYPIFLVDQDVNFAQCKIKSVDDISIYDYKNVIFEYTIDGNKFENLQQVPDSIKIQIGKSYKVQYLIENPEISRLWWW